MEKQLKIKTPDGKILYGTLRGSVDKPLVVFVHGFTGWKDEHQFFNGARFLEKHGLSSFRFDLYNWQKGARRLEETTLSSNAVDLDLVIEYLRKQGANDIFVVGHSFGGLVVLLSKKQGFSAAVLWDPSINPANTTKAKYVKELDLYYVGKDSSYGFTIGKDMYEENKKLKPLELIRKFTKPIKIIVAGDGWLVAGGKRYYKAASNPKDIAIINGATHCFDEYGTEESLFRETLKWLKRYS